MCCVHPAIVAELLFFFSPFICNGSLAYHGQDLGPVVLVG